MAAVRASRSSSLPLRWYHPAGISLLPDSNHMCSHDVTLRIPSKPRVSRGSPHERMCFTYTLAWRTHPIQIHISSLASVRPWDRLTSTACVSGPDFTRAGAHAVASCEARHGPRAHCRANPARSSKRLRPLLGPCPSSGAVSVAIQRTHSCVP